MTPRKHTIFAVALVIASTASFKADAAIQWSFDIGGCNPDASSVGNVCDFEPIAGTIPPGDTALGAKAEAWANTGSGGSLEQAIMRDHGSYGAGVRHAGSAGLETNYSPQHAMDNDGYLEFMLFDFQGQEVQLTDVTLGWETDSDLTILAYAGAGMPDLNADFVQKNGSTSGGDESLTGTGGWVSVAQIANADYYFNFYDQSYNNGNEITSSYWIVAAYASAFGSCNTGSGGCGENQDHVKLWDVGGIIHNTPTPPNSVPAPTSALLLGGLLPLLRRRRV